MTARASKCWLRVLQVFTVALALLGLRFVYEGYSWMKRFDQWRVAKPIDISVDVSKAGQFVGEFRQTCHVSHGEAIFLEVPADVVRRTPPDQLLAGLRCRIEIDSGDKANVFADDFTGTLAWNDAAEPSKIPLLHIPTFQDGEYSLKLTVSQGVPLLTGVSQRLVASYRLCGAELAVAWMAFFVGGVILLIALILAIVAVVWARRRRAAPPVPVGGGDPSASSAA